MNKTLHLSFCGSKLLQIRDGKLGCQTLIMFDVLDPLADRPSRCSHVRLQEGRGAQFQLPNSICPTLLHRLQVSVPPMLYWWRDGMQSFT